ncbi:MAG: TlpA family protein disulfide reductase [Elusimicrobia bacterium]|nr:TlpA family protein disulfide reductase [Elusimicrobiota bacterium]
MKNVKLFSFLILAAAVAGFACKKKEAPAPDAQKSPEAAITATVKADKIDPGYIRKAHYFKLPAANGGEIDLAAYAGKTVMVMFFTESCPYCRKAAPFLEKVYKTYSSKGLNIIGICIQENADAPKAFAHDLGLTFPLAYKGGPIYRKYEAQGVPFIYLLDKSHEVYEVWQGYSPEYDAEIIKNVERALK